MIKFSFITICVRFIFVFIILAFNLFISSFFFVIFHILTDPKSEMGKSIATLVHDGLSYLDTRSDFWRQQKPMYARRHDRLMQRRKRETASHKLAPNDYIIKELERIDQGNLFKTCQRNSFNPWVVKFVSLNILLSLLFGPWMIKCAVFHTSQSNKSFLHLLISQMYWYFFRGHCIQCVKFHFSENYCCKKLTCLSNGCEFVCSCFQ